MPRRHPHLIWAGRVLGAVILAGLVVYLARAGLERADKVASCVGAVAGISAVLGPYLFPPRQAAGSPPVASPPAASPQAASPQAASPQAASSPVAGSSPDVAVDSGGAEATGGGRANSGVGTSGDRPARASRTGAATARGPGSVANSGVLRGLDGRE